MATVNCIYCGAPCNKHGNDEYECPFCGATFGESDIVPENGKQAASGKNEQGADVFEKNIQGILEVSCVGMFGSWVGSGFIVTPSGYAITNAHVAAEEETGLPCLKMSVNVCGKSVPATVVALADDKAGSGKGDDLAIIKLSGMPAGAIPLSFEKSDKLRNGEKVYAIGNSLGCGTCITEGIVSDKLRKVSGKNLIMTDCAVNPGNSGGPMFNSQGKVVGAIVAGINGAEGMNYAIPSNTITDFLRKNNIVFSEDTQTYCPHCGSVASKFSFGNVCRKCGYKWH